MEGTTHDLHLLQIGSIVTLFCFVLFFLPRWKHTSYFKRKTAAEERMAISYRHAGYGRQAKSLRNLNFVSMIALFIWATLPFGYFGVGYVQFPGVEPCLMEQIAVKYGWAHVLLANNLNHLLMLLKFRVTCFTKPKPIANVKPALALSSFFALLVSLMMLSEILVLISGFHIEKFAGGVHCEVYLLSSIFTTVMVSLEVPIVCLGIYLFSLPFLSLYSLGRVHSSPAATLGHMEVSSAALQHRQSHPTLTATNSSSNLVERRPQLPPHIRRPLLLNLIGVLVCQLSIIVSALFCFVIPGPGDFPLAHHLQEELMPAIVACNCLGICVMFGDPIYVLRELDHALDRLISSRAFSLTAPVQRSAAAAAASADRPRRPHHPYAAPALRRARRWGRRT